MLIILIIIKYKQKCKKIIQRLKSQIHAKWTLSPIALSYVVSIDWFAIIKGLNELNIILCDL